MSTVLIVGNDDSLRASIRTLFEQGGNFDSCIEAAGGSEAIDIAREIFPHLAILDFSLPDMNGLRLARELRKIMPRLPIFMLTADDDLRAEEEALSRGINAVFSKV